MNTLIKTLPLALLLALAGGAAAADPPTESAATPAPAPRMAARHMDAAAMTERMTRHLGLSPEQAREVEQINERFAAQVEEHRKQAESMRAAHREAVHKIGAQRDAELKKVLSEEQFRKHAEQKQMMQERRREHGGPGGKGPRPPAGAAPPPPAQ